MDRNEFKRILFLRFFDTYIDVPNEPMTFGDADNLIKKVDLSLHNEKPKQVELEDMRDVGQTFADALERTVHELHNNRELYWAWRDKLALVIYTKAEENENFDLRRTDHQLAFKEWAEDCADQFLTDLIQDTLEIKFDRTTGSDRDIDI